MNAVHVRIEKALDAVSNTYANDAVAVVHANLAIAEGIDQFTRELRVNNLIASRDIVAASGAVDLELLDTLIAEYVTATIESEGQQ